MRNSSDICFRLCLGGDTLYMKVKAKSFKDLITTILYFISGGWNILNRYGEEAPSSNHQWSLLENLPIVQVKFGVHPFFKVSIEDGNITLSEGELGLPNEQLYYYHRDHPVRFIKLQDSFSNHLTI